jgi:rhodanese-related sulfurtransferase
MKHMQKALTLSVALTLAVFSGCSSDDDDDGGNDPVVTEFQTLVDYTDDNAVDWNAGWIQAASYVNDNLADLHVLDLRASTDFADGHIPGAVNVTLDNLLDNAGNNGGKTIALICYTGQTAAFATMALRMADYDAFSMKFGMSAWNDALSGSWDNSVSDAFATAFVADESAALPEFTTAPTINTGMTDAGDILAAQVEDVLGSGYKGVTAVNLFDTLDDYAVYNYWSNADYIGHGHIPGALQLDPGTLTSDENLTAMDPDGMNAIYCWTGQTGSLTAFYLNVLGYDTYNVKFGANAMIHSDLGGHSWTPTGFNYTLEGGETVNEFELLKEEADASFATWNAGWLQSAEYVNTNVEDGFVLVMDLRSEADYLNGHIEGAINTTLGTLLADVAANIGTLEEVCTVCYTGQTASFAAMALRMSDYNAYALKWGMAAWNDDYAGSWTNSTSNHLAADFVMDASEALPSNAWPALTTGMTTGPAILAAQIDAILAEGFGANAMTSEFIIDDIADYTVFNYWNASDYEHYGHIPTAYQLDAGSANTNLAAFGGANTQALYCWSGQTSALTTFFLNVMGYDVMSLKFGANGMIYDVLESHKWSAQGFNYPVVTD